MDNSRFKFRVWSKPDRCFLDKEICTINFDGSLILNGEFDMSPMKNDFELTQSTGLYDCEGREVFEGDVCEYSYVDWRSNKFEGLCLIFWNDFLFKFDSMTIKDSHNDMHSELPLCRNVSSLTLKIIGNRFENPELLEAQK